MAEIPDGVVKFAIVLAIWALQAWLGSRSKRKRERPPAPPPPVRAPAPPPAARVPPPLPRPAPAPAPAPPPPLRRAPAGGVPDAWSIVSWESERVLGAADALAQSLGSDPRPAALREAVERARALALAARARAEASLFPEGETTSRGTSLESVDRELEEELEQAETASLAPRLVRARAALEALSRLVPSRRAEGLVFLSQAAEGAAGETWARIAESLSARGVAVPRLAPVAAFGPAQDLDPTGFVELGLLPVVLATGVRTSPAPWAGIVGQVWRAAAVAVPGLGEELAERALLPWGEETDEQVAAVGRIAVAWAPALSADIASVAALGPSALAAHARQVENMSALDRVAFRADDAGRVDAQPPPSVRLHALAAAAGQLGFRAEADAALERLAAVTREPVVVVRAPSAARKLASAPFEAHVAAYAESLLSEPLTALGLASLEGVAGAEPLGPLQVEAAQALLRLEAGREAPARSYRVLLVAAARLGDRESVAPEALAALHRSLEARAATSRPVPGASVASPRRQRSGAGSPALAVRDALVLAEVLSPPPALR